jgi:hypothetical protein
LPQIKELFKTELPLRSCYVGYWAASGKSEQGCTKEQEMVTVKGSVRCPPHLQITTTTTTTTTMNPINCFLWGHLMENVYLILPTSPEDTTAHLHVAMGTVNDGMLQNVRDSIVQRANRCIRVGGGLFEHLL